MRLAREVLEPDFLWLEERVRTRQPRRVPVVLSWQEVGAVRARMDGDPRLVACLLYGSGLHLQGACTLGANNLDINRGGISVHSARAS